MGQVQEIQATVRVGNARTRAMLVRDRRVATRRYLELLKVGKATKAAVAKVQAELDEDDAAVEAADAEVLQAEAHATEVGVEV